MGFAELGKAVLPWRAAASAGVLMLCLHGGVALAYCGGEYNGGDVAPPTPIDSDCDNVPDVDDLCPQLQGPRNNGGCPVSMEVVVVTGVRSGVVCPNGLVAASQSHCPGFTYWRNSYTTLTYSRRTHQVSSMNGAPACGATVDAGCACGAGKVKVYDEGENEFHCYGEPPADGCPLFGQTFDFDLSVWACTEKPFGSDMKAAAERLKDCVGSNTVIGRNWSRVPRFRDMRLGYWGAVDFNAGTTGEVTGVVQVIFDTAFIAGNCRHCKAGKATKWHEFVLTEYHEFGHVKDHHKYGLHPWEDDTFKIIIRAHGFAATEIGYEGYAELKARERYEADLGVRTTYNRSYDAAVDGRLPCSLYD